MLSFARKLDILERLLLVVGIKIEGEEITIKRKSQGKRRRPITTSSLPKAARLAKNVIATYKGTSHRKGEIERLGLIIKPATKIHQILINSPQRFYDKPESFSEVLLALADNLKLVRAEEKKEAKKWFLRVGENLGRDSKGRNNPGAAAAQLAPAIQNLSEKRIEAITASLAVYEMREHLLRQYLSLHKMVLYTYFKQAQRQLAGKAEISPKKLSIWMYTLRRLRVAPYRNLVVTLCANLSSAMKYLKRNDPDGAKTFIRLNEDLISRLYDATKQLRQKVSRLCTRPDARKFKDAISYYQSLILPELAEVFAGVESALLEAKIFYQGGETLKTHERLAKALERIDW